MEIFKSYIKESSENVLRDRAFNIAKKPKYDECQRRLTSIN